MKIVAISDSHGFAPALISPCDLLLISGDIFPVDQHAPGSRYSPGWIPLEIQRQVNWFNLVFHEWVIRQKKNGVKNIAVIAGNHDFGFRYARDKINTTEYNYLEDSSCVCCGYKIYGSPWSAWFYDWVFMTTKNDHDESELTLIFDKIPADTDILLTHTPPYGILDKTLHNDRAGSKALIKKLDTLTNLKLHCFGHIHPNTNEGRISEYKGITMVNAGILNEHYENIFKPTILELPTK